MTYQNHRTYYFDESVDKSNFWFYLCFSASISVQLRFFRIISQSYLVIDFTESAEKNEEQRS